MPIQDGTCLLDQGCLAEAKTVLERALALRRAKSQSDLIDSTERALVLRARRANGET